jgi:hypothetical protein
MRRSIASSRRAAPAPIPTRNEETFVKAGHGARPLRILPPAIYGPPGRGARGAARRGCWSDQE